MAASHTVTSTTKAGLAITGKHFDRSLVALVNRITGGFTLEEYEFASSLGYEGYLEYQLDHENIDDSELDASFAHFSTLPMGAALLKQTIKDLQPNDPNPILELQAHATMRALYSKRQLYERMVEFWTYHFNIDIHDKSCRMLKSSDDRDVIRPNAMATFADLLSASAHSAAMMYYLDNYNNKVGAPQENYGREIMELHSLGVTGPYTEQDVKEVSRCLTGWSLVHPNSPNFGDFLYIDANHDQGEKTVLGVTIPAGGGKTDGDTVLQMLATHESTAQFVGGKLTRWLLGYEPSQTLLNKVAQVFLNTGGDVKSLIRVILKPANLEAFDPWSNPKMRRPFQFTTALIRAVGAQIDDQGDPENQSFLQIELDKMGMEPFGWGPPTGYPDSLAAWGSSLRGRWSFASRLMANEILHVSVSPAQVIRRLEKASKGDMASKVSALLTGGTMSFHDESVLRSYFGSFPEITWPIIAEGIAFASTSPSFQFY